MGFVQIEKRETKVAKNVLNRSEIRGVLREVKGYDHDEDGDLNPLYDRLVDALVALVECGANTDNILECVSETLGVDVGRSDVV